VPKRTSFPGWPRRPGIRLAQCPPACWRPSPRPRASWPRRRCACGRTRLATVCRASCNTPISTPGVDAGSSFLGRRLTLDLAVDLKGETGGVASATRCGHDVLSSACLLLGAGTAERQAKAPSVARGDVVSAGPTDLWFLRVVYRLCYLHGRLLRLFSCLAAASVAAYAAAASSSCSKSAQTATATWPSPIDVIIDMVLPGSLEWRSPLAFQWVVSMAQGCVATTAGGWVECGGTGWTCGRATG